MISAKQNIGIEELKNHTVFCQYWSLTKQRDNRYKYKALRLSCLKRWEVTKVKYGLETNLPSDLMARHQGSLISFWNDYRPGNQ
jgi:tRNA modification GTPase